MDKKVIKFNETEMEKFYQHKNPISIDNIDINKIVVSSKVTFIGYKDAKKLDLYAYYPQK